MVAWANKTDLIDLIIKEYGKLAALIAPIDQPQADPSIDCRTRSRSSTRRHHQFHTRSAGTSMQIADLGSRGGNGSTPKAEVRHRDRYLLL